MNNIGYYNRRACQRCHAQKLSCRPETQTECIRCIKASTKCVPRSPLRTRKGNNSSEQRPQHSRHSVSGNDENEPVRSTAELSNFSDDMWGGICTEETTGETSEGPDMSNANSYLSMIPSSQWFTDLVATNTLTARVASNIPVGPSELAYRSDDYTTPPSPVDPGDSVFDPLGYAQFLVSQQELPSTSLEMPLAEALPTVSRNISDGFCKKIWVEELARLNSRISSHDHSVNSSSSEHTTPERSRSCSLSTESGKSPMNGPVCLDDALALTKDLIELLDRLQSPEDPSARSDISKFGDGAFRNMSQDIALGTSIQHLDISVSNKRMSIPNVISEDPFTILLFMSCYVRLIGIYKLLFARIRSVVTNEGPQAASPLLLRSQLPTIVVGPFSLRSNPNLEVMLIIELVDSVIAHIGHAARLLTPGTTGDPSQDLGRGTMTPKGTHSMDHIVVSMLSAVQESEKGLMGSIHNIRDILTQKHLSPDTMFS
ncbi:hypothetical protein HBI56_068090 [Parastagonospora nodorum]|uniref:Zn(2)-C6 fungal-type domain-containing protein n=2 Tax=Phaeosphaeria nodorum (strain SN15 / ATCC MYA-4574 / FGSC 10173) TaxID=321614 RepID=A0A7U2HSH2_PHANO|nr:hypothetical protein SNOG_09617 [Parastagonospora nodorum SN15]KAH3920297.1 hypothetical protein HBH56_002590 [Parastagonospora nodorum]EAT82882.1 hypothetical protein SNOG_09617 [Parastagonospora nodorum SN15]KAH3938222.1 hypothetical protein HBH54_002590 [Parastagonospora nodorum]KAH3946514.1 hypothetical protein HBH53_129490 [Parastagonospora nodorum]KAH3975030.1 hypothetical protein HBH51_085360 [Parastagonospora nodorum]